GQRLLGQLDHARHAVLEQLVDQLALVGKAPVGGADADPRTVGDLVEADREALGGEQLVGGVEDAAAVAFGVGAERLLGGHGRKSTHNWRRVLQLCASLVLTGELFSSSRTRSL